MQDFVSLQAESKAAGDLSAAAVPHCSVSHAVVPPWRPIPADWPSGEKQVPTASPAWQFWIGKANLAEQQQVQWTGNIHTQKNYAICQCWAENKVWCDRRNQRGKGLLHGCTGQEPPAAPYVDRTVCWSGGTHKAADMGSLWTIPPDQGNSSLYMI